MAKPYRGSPFKELERDREHMKDIAAALRSLKERFGAEQIPFAVIGGIALRRYGYERFTEDVDILTTREGLDRIHEKFAGRGINPRAAGLRKKLIDSEHQVNIDVITAGEHAGSEASPVVYPVPGGEAFVEFEGVLYPRLDRLVEFKLASHIWGKRATDFSDVVRLIQANRLDESFTGKLHDGVRTKYIEALDFARGEKSLE